ncbi:Thioredoxin domain-containing protein [Psidium guajava]|nr:Thioredoxin domain-containing protein [Psidium guajava]
MATVLESLAVPRSSSLPSPAAFSPVAPASSLAPIACRRRSAGFPQASGLRIRPVSIARSLRSPSQRPRRAPGVVCEAQDTAVEVAPVTDATWQSNVMESEFPVLVEFWAPWCGPCRMIHPVIDELAKQYAGKLKCYKVNTDESPSIATRYGIRSIPTVMIFKSGEKKDAVIGAVPKSTLTTSIEKFL